MKATLVRSVVTIAVFVLLALSSRADRASYAQVIKERDAVLSKILAMREATRSSGLADEEGIASAQLALYSFRRDVASTTAEKIKNQELIVKVRERKLEEMKARVSIGVGDNTDVLVATDSLLQAKQVLEELRSNGKEGYKSPEPTPGSVTPAASAPAAPPPSAAQL
jgi:hypothetical protein